MSTSSTTYNDNKYNENNSNNTLNTTKNASNAEPFKTRRVVNKNIPIKKRSNERVLDELSTFIAEFSYLTNGRDSKPETPNNPIRSYNTYLVQSSENNERIFNKKVNSTRPNQNSYNPRRKSVEWIDQTPPHRDRKKRVQLYSETPVETSDVGNPYISKDPTDSDYIFEHSTNRSPNKRIRIKSGDENRYGKLSSTLKRRKSSYDGKKLIGQRFRVESNERIRKGPHEKVRRKQSKSPVRYWPLRYEKKKTKYRIEKHPLVRKKNCIPLERKEVISSNSPTVITLFPKNAREKLSQDKVDEIEFLTDPNLPCKCFKCMKKFEILKQISNDELDIIYYKPKTELQPTSVYNDDGIECHPRNLFKQPAKCVCKKTRRSCHTVIHQNNPKPVENNLFYPHALNCTSFYDNTFFCNTKNHRRYTQSFSNFYGCPKNLFHYSLPPLDQSCLPKQIEDDCCRRRQFYEPYSNLRCHKLKPCPYPCDDEHFKFNLNEIGSCDEQSREKCYKSVFFRFDCVGHQIDPAVTQYFHSILNNK